MLVACADDKLGDLDVALKKPALTFLLPITADRMSHSIRRMVDTFAAEEPDVLETRDEPRLRHRSRMDGRAAAWPVVS